MSLNLPWYKWYHDWYRKESRIELNLAERGLYRECLDLHYQEGSIPANLTVLRRWINVDKDEFDKAWPKVSKHFTSSQNDDSRLVNSRALKELKKLLENSSNQALKGRKGGLAKGKKLNKTTTSGSKATAKPLPSRGKNPAKPNPGHKDTDTDTESPLPPKGVSWADRFDEWWSLWPKKTAKPDAKKAYLRLVVNGKAKPEQADDLKPFPDFDSRHAQLVEATKGWALEFARRDIDKVPYPATFLNRLDWLSAPANGNSASGAPSLAEAQARLKRTKLAIDSPQKMAWEHIPQWHDRLRKLGWPIPS